MSVPIRYLSSLHLPSDAVTVQRFCLRSADHALHNKAYYTRYLMMCIVFDYLATSWTRCSHREPILRMLDYFRHAFSEIIHVLRRDTCHAHSPILGQVYMVLVNHSCHLSLRQPRVAEHANLVRNVPPV